MKVDWKKFSVLFILLNVMLWMGGCSASWVGAINSLWPAISAAISAIFAFIGSVKTVPASVETAVQKIEADVQASLQSATTLLAQLASDASATVAQQFTTALQFISTNLQSILTGISVTDPATQSTATKLVNLAIAAIEAVLVLVPLLSPKAGSLATQEDLAKADAAATSSIKNTHKVLQHSYHAVVSEATGDIAVDEALAALPQQLP